MIQMHFLHSDRVERGLRNITENGVVTAIATAARKIPQAPSPM
jgi:hypothetical protein